MTLHPTALLAFAASCALAHAAPQGTAPPSRDPEAAVPAPDSQAAQFLLDLSFDKMLAWSRGSFATAETHNSAISRQFGGAGFGPLHETAVEGRWERGLVEARFGEGDVVAQNVGRRVYKIGDAWHLRQHWLTTDKACPFIFDPELCFRWLKMLPPDERPVVHTSATTMNGRRAIVLGVQLSEAASQEFLLSEITPRPQTIQSMTMGFGPRGMLAGESEPPTVDLAWTVDAETGDVLNMRVQVDIEEAMIGQMQVAVAVAPLAAPGGAPVPAPNAVPDAATAAPAPSYGDTDTPAFEQGIPQRELTGTITRAKFQIDFRELGQPNPIALTPDAASLLGTNYRSPK